MIQCKCIITPGENRPAQAQTTHRHSRVLLNPSEVPVPLQAVCLQQGGRSLQHYLPGACKRDERGPRECSTVLHAFRVHARGATPQEQTPCCNRILLELASRRHFQVPYGDAGRERISVSQQEVGVVAHSFTPIPFFLGLNWVIW